jgi:23S rRNA (pseudouridine1915-N3)-methyltransferase
VRITLLAVGRSRDPLIGPLTRRYLERCPWPTTLREIEPRGRRAGEAPCDAEATALLAALPPGAVAIALDASGELLDSAAFAARLGGWRDGGERDLAFLIGGADGHGPAVRAAARLVLALGRLTWPHELVRVLIAEQLYRAHTILAGHPYHRA